MAGVQVEREIMPKTRILHPGKATLRAIHIALFATATGTTGKDGVLHLKSKELTEIADLRVLALSDSGAATCDLNLSSLVAPLLMFEKAWFNTPLQWYRPGEIVQLSGLLRTPNKGIYQSPPENHRTFTLTCIARRSGRLIHKAPIKLNDHGSFNTRFLIPTSMKNGAIVATLSRKEGEKVYV